MQILRATIPTDFTHILLCFFFPPFIILVAIIPLHVALADIFIVPFVNAASHVDPAVMHVCLRQAGQVGWAPTRGNECTSFSQRKW